MKNLVKVTARKSAWDSVTFYAYEGSDYSDMVSQEYKIESFESTCYNHANTAQEVCAHLAGDWSIEPMVCDPDTSFRLTRADGLRLYFRPTEDWKGKGKGYVSYDRPRDKDGKWVYAYGPAPLRAELKDPSINYALTKSPEQVAKDISRRLLPDAEALHAQVIARVEQANAYLDRCDKAEATARALNERSRHGVGFSFSGAAITINGVVTPEIARKIADFLGAIPDAK